MAKKQKRKPRLMKKQTGTVTPPKPEPASKRPRPTIPVKGKEVVKSVHAVFNDYHSRPAIIIARSDGQVTLVGRIEEGSLDLIRVDTREFDRTWRPVLLKGVPHPPRKAAQFWLGLNLDEERMPLHVRHVLERIAAGEQQVQVPLRAAVETLESGETVKKGRRSRRNKGSGEDAHTITLLVTENPRRKGTTRAARYALYRTGMTVGEFLAAGGFRGDLRCDTTEGHIKIS